MDNSSQSGHQSSPILGSTARNSLSSQRPISSLDFLRQQFSPVRATDLTVGLSFAATQSVIDIPGKTMILETAVHAFDFNYRVPGLRNWLTFYADSLAEDEFSPDCLSAPFSLVDGLLYAEDSRDSKTAIACGRRLHGSSRVTRNLLEIGTQIIITIADTQMMAHIMGNWVGRRGPWYPGMGYLLAYRSQQLSTESSKASGEPRILERWHTL